MSVSSLQSQLNQLERQLRKAQQYNSQLRGELSSAASGANKARNELEEYNRQIRNTLDECTGEMRSSHKTIVDSIALQGEIERLYVRFKNIELANKKIRAANNKKYYDFANYRTVRKIVQGIMDNLDVQMISNETITKSVEKQHLQTPDYWLTCVLISIMAWRNDDKALADRAMARAIKLDKKSCTVFYMLFNLRMGREEAALKWFYTYQECELKGSDQRTFLMLFSLVNKTIADDIKDKTKKEVFDFIKKVVEQNMKASGYSEKDIVSQICGYLDRMRHSEKLSYPLLRKCCGEIKQLTAVMTQAKNNINILEFILRTVNVSVEERNTFLKGYIDEIVAAPNPSEKEVYETIAYNELIIMLEGDVQTAKQTFAAQQEKKAKELNLIAEMIQWIYERDSAEINGQIRCSMFTLTKSLQEKAVEALAKRYRSQRKTKCQVNIGVYDTVMDFGREDEEQQKMTSFFTQKRDEALDSIKNVGAYIWFGVGAAAAVGSFFLWFWLLVLTLIGAGAGIGILLSNSSKRKQIRQSFADEIRNTRETISRLFDEFKQYQAELDEYDSFYDRCIDELHKI